MRPNGPAARGGLDLAPFPWGGPYIRNIYGRPLANFKPMRGDYVEDAGCHTVPIESYSPNDYGLYQMAGNVAEWTNTAFDETVYDFSHDMAPVRIQCHGRRSAKPQAQGDRGGTGRTSDIGRRNCSFEYRTRRNRTSDSAP